MDRWVAQDKEALLSYSDADIYRDAGQGGFEIRTYIAAAAAAGGMGKIQRVQDDINEVTDMMRANIEAVVDRGEHLELLVDKSDALGSQAQAFQKQSVGLRKAMWWQNMKMVFALAFIVLFILALILFTTCGWALKKCRASQ